MQSARYTTRRGELETYFDRTATRAWQQLTSDAPVSGIRATVRAGRDQMRATLLSWLPDDLTGKRLLDAGCGTGSLAIEAARRGASVLATDLSPNLIRVAQDRLHGDAAAERIEFRSADMLDEALGEFDFVVAMDSLIHYHAQDITAALRKLSARTRSRVLFTFAPRTPLLTLMHSVGRAFPRADRAPSIEPVAERHLRTLIEADAGFDRWDIARTRRIDSSFYKSQAMELVRA
jgi:magnesium-protoporphyrin O-methyltransferase